MRYNPDTLNQLCGIVNRWQHDEQLTSYESKMFGNLVYNVANDRWNAHYGHSRRDWTDTKLIREEVPLAFLQYLKMKRSVRLAGRNACPLNNQVYPSLPYVMNEFRRQFPRIISVLTANHVGITLLQPYEPRNICYMVRLPIYTELHHALCIMRRISNSMGGQVYLARRHDERLIVFRELYTMAGRNVPSDLTNRVAQRRMIVVNAASDILASRILHHHDACHNRVSTNRCDEYWVTNSTHEEH